MSDHVTAVVLAHSRLESLEELLDALEAQTRPPDDVLIVNSAATPPVASAIARAVAAGRASELVLGRNGGSAGGFAAGIDAAAARPEVDLIWAFDDDAVPDARSLELLLDARPSLTDVGVLAAASTDPSGELAWAMYPADGGEPIRSIADLSVRAARDGGALAVSELAWHALLIPAEVARTVGSPDEELFMWYEDVEYGLRLRRAGLRLYVVPGTVVRHPAPPRTIRFRLLGVPVEVPVTNGWKSYLMVRNSLVVRRAYSGARFWWVDLPLALLRALLVSFAVPGPRLSLLRNVLVRGVVDGMRRRGGPPPPEVMALGVSGKR